jgi:hypothetical protein
VTRRSQIFAGIALASVVGAAAHVGLAEQNTQPAEAVAGAKPTTPLPLAGGAIPGPPFLVFTRQSGSPDGKDSSLGVAPLSDLKSPHFDEAIRCDRVDMSGGRGVCLSRRGRFSVQYFAVLFDASFKPVGELEIAGIPSRVQVSPSGRYAGTTVFVAGHGYTDGNFSTRASILDLESRRWLIEDMETLAVRRDGRTIRDIDFNFWGVTFAKDERTYYATLGTGGKTFLVRGDLQTRVVEVIEDDLECPSLSPDDARVAFKHRTSTGPGPMTWQVWVLDLKTRARHPLAETRNVDDQVQWLDDDDVLYSLPGSKAAVMDTWVVPADGSGTPELFLPASYSAGVVRR